MDGRRPSLLILLPDGHIHKLVLPFLKTSFREAPLTATMLAALTPPELGFSIEICDASVSEVPYEGKYDLVAISVITGTAVEGYRLADHFRAKGAKVVIGGDPLYWFLVCKGARTYRFLPTFFKRFTPGAAAEPELAARLRRVAAARFPNEYDAATGVLHFTDETDRLKSDVLRMDAESVRFRTLNPGWAKGEELCCFVPLAMDNLNRLGERVIAAVEPEWRV